MIVTNPARCITVMMTEEEVQVLFSALVHYRGPWPSDIGLSDIEIKHRDRWIANKESMRHVLECELLARATEAADAMENRS